MTLWHFVKIAICTILGFTACCSLIAWIIDWTFRSGATRCYRDEGLTLFRFVVTHEIPAIRDFFHDMFVGKKVTP